ncbi:PLDc N-terminal domain-containing protein [Kocuria rhizophila]|uniref:PLDc N-terminal domain-containing protein n=1 Tax=Kocuria rhizophila TaxID=72000 RepID=UPI000EB1DAFD|nr:PLDc N-terminal domain-containing protein [Kocuria rhizophila]
MNPLVPSPFDVFMLALLMVSIVLWAIALWSLAQNRHFTPTQRLLWLILILAAPIIGPALWLTVGRRVGATAAG